MRGTRKPPCSSPLTLTAENDSGLVPQHSLLSCRPTQQLPNLLHLSPSFPSPPHLSRLSLVGISSRAMSNTNEDECWICGECTKNRCSACTNAEHGMDICLCSRTCQKLVRPSFPSY